MLLFTLRRASTALTLDSNALGPNLTLFDGGMCVRNLANKAWTTVRATCRFSKGLHYWEVLVERCVSKNIFVGVSTREASLANYVGSDNQGWGYLANTALWHKKVRSGFCLHVSLLLSLSHLPRGRGRNVATVSCSRREIQSESSLIWMLAHSGSICTQPRCHCRCICPLFITLDAFAVSQ